ncbi:MAG: NAD-dependent epimerase/dehydratase family protein, partial [Oligoflexia bacterium]|nr:NAD-dependent epimerase/dehydratase family protein [Oligoflexia bacterium]
MHLHNDLSFIIETLNNSGGVFEHFRGKHLFLTGATELFGKWLLETFVYANQTLNLQLKISALSRDPEKFAKKFPHLANTSCIDWYQGDIKNFQSAATVPSHPNFIIHAATEASEKINNQNPLEMLDTIIIGTRRILEYACSCNNTKDNQTGLESVLLISSGAIYGKQPPNISHIPEEYLGGPTVHDAKSAYSEGKRTAELLAAIYIREHDLPIKIARCFAFVGPHLPLDAHFAVGNFIGDLLAGRTIVIKGDGTPLRSYLYMADLVVWLLKILIDGKNNVPYNVGSDQAISIKSLAELVISVGKKNIKNMGLNKLNKEHANNQNSIEILGTKIAKKDLEQYIPSINKAKKELGLE